MMYIKSAKRFNLYHMKKFSGCWSALVFLFIAGISSIHPACGQDHIRIGWAAAEITPSKPVLLAGQFHARVSEGVMDPITATALAMEVHRNGEASGVVMISCDLVSIPDGLREGANLRDRVRALLTDLSPALRAEDIILNATHTHAAPVLSSTGNVEDIYGVELEMMAPGSAVMSPVDYAEFAAQQIAAAGRRAWNVRKPGGISYGVSAAVIGQNRLQAQNSGKSIIYGDTNQPDFSHIEGYEDHTVNLLYTWDDKGLLSGVVINVAVPSQVSEMSFLISADFWHDTRTALGARLGKDIHILAQTGSAGDQSPHFMWGARAEERMQQIMGLDAGGVGRGSNAHRRQIAMRISDAVMSILPYMERTIDWSPMFAHEMKNVALSRRLLGKQDIKDAKAEIVKWQKKYDQLLQEIKASPDKTRKSRWYKEITISFSHLRRAQSVLTRYELEKVQPKLPVEVHVIRIGDVVFASNPFELYLDYGIQIKARSAATQTFIVELAGSGTYLPTSRSIAGGAYGAVPASTLIGPEGGKELVEETLKMVNSLWEEM
jgi:hypothetical protein